MADELKDVIEGLGKTFDEFKKKNDERLVQIEKDGKADPLLEGQLTKMNERLDELGAIKTRLTEAENAFARRTPATDDGTSGKMQAKADQFARMVAKSRGIPASELVKDFGPKGLSEYKAHFQEWMRKGDRYANQPEALKSLSVGSDPDGGYFVEPDTSGRIVTKIFETSPMRQVANVLSIGTDALEGIFDLDEVGSGWVGETEARPDTTTPKLAAWRIPVHEMYAQPLITQKLLDDSLVDLESWLAEKVSTKFARKENAAFVVGDGVGKPRGFLTYPAGTTLPGSIQQVSTGVSGGFATDGTGGDVLLDAIYSLKQGYRPNSRWFMPRTATGQVRQLKAGDGTYLWAPGIGATQPATLLGYPILEFEDMPQIGANSLSIAYGDMAETYQIVDRIGVRVLRDPFTSKPYIKFYTTKRVGGDVINFEAMKIIKFAS
jgi:HK97 family phage major capsid protein